MAVSDEEIRWVISMMAAKMLTAAGGEEQRPRLKRAVRDWLPNQDQVDEFELRTVVEKVAAGFLGMANLVDERLERLVASGKARPYDSSSGLLPGRAPDAAGGGSAVPGEHRHGQELGA